MISSMDLFLRRDLGGGCVGLAPAVDAPAAEVVVDSPAAAGVAPAVAPKRPPAAGAAEVVLGPAVVVAGVLSVVVVAVVVAGLPKSPPVGVAGAAESAGLAPNADAAEVVVVLEAGALVVVAPPNKPPVGAAAGADVEAGVVEEIVPNKLPAGLEAGAVEPNRLVVGAVVAGVVARKER
jgi:hypothetical protein